VKLPRYIKRGIRHDSQRRLFFHQCFLCCS